MCETLNKPERDHPLHLCRNKQQYLEMKKCNLSEVNKTEIDELLNIALYYIINFFFFFENLI